MSSFQLVVLYFFAPHTYAVRARVLSGTRVFVRPYDATNARTFSGPTSVNIMSVAVLSLRRIMASNTVRSETTPLTAGD